MGPHASRCCKCVFCWDSAHSCFCHNVLRCVALRCSGYGSTLCHNVIVSSMAVVVLINLRCTSHEVLARLWSPQPISIPTSYWQICHLIVCMPCFGQDEVFPHERTRLAWWAAKHEKPECLRVCHASGKMDLDLGHISQSAAGHGNMACLRLTLEIGDKWNFYTSQEAAAGGIPYYHSYQMQSNIPYAPKVARGHDSA
jgi:hypothetical protein